MIGASFGVNLGTLAAVYLALLIFGIVFNQITEWAEKRGYAQGYLSLFVSFGVGMTVLATAIISPLFALITLGAFVASGTPMILGSIWRHVRNREREIEALRKEAHGDTSKEMAPRG